MDESDERIKRGAAMLKKHGVAAEINYHTNEPEPEFFRLYIEQGVKIVFGSDSHNLCEIGDFFLTCG